MEPRNPRHPLFKKEALKPGPVANKGLVESNAYPIQDYPDTGATTEALMYILGAVVLCSLMSMFPDMLSLSGKQKGKEEPCSPDQ